MDKTPLARTHVSLPASRHVRASLRGTFAAMTYSHEPDIRPLGALALAAAVVSVALSWTYFLSPLAYLAAVVALSLGLLSRGHERSRSLGSLAVVLAVLALVVATVTLLVV